MPGPNQYNHELIKLATKQPLSKLYVTNPFNIPKYYNQLKPRKQGELQHSPTWAMLIISFKT